MKHLIFLLAFLSISFISTSQINIKEDSFKKIEGFIMLDKYNYVDDNNLPMALIKISTENINAKERRKIKFKGNLETYFDVQFQESEIYLYLSTAATFIEIHHPDYGKTEFWLPEDLCDFCGYEMILTNNYQENTVIEEKIVYIKVPETNTENIQKPRIFIDLNYAYTSLSASSFGLSFGKINEEKVIGWYANIMSNFNFKYSLLEDYECDSKGFVDGQTCYYTGLVEKMKLSALCGLTFKITEKAYMKFGIGVGSQTIAWENTSNRLVKNKDYSIIGADLNIGMMYIFNKINTSIDIVSTNVKTWEIKLGIGFNFKKK